MMKFKRFGFRDLLIIVLLAAVLEGRQKLAFSAPCCSRNSAVPILISGDDEAQVNFGSSIAGVVGQVFDDGVPIFGSSLTSEYVRAMRLEGALLVSDRLQLGVGVPLVHYSYTVIGETEASTRMGDIRLSLGYEFMPLWSYSRWKPQGFLFSVVTLPTGRSRYESQTLLSTDVTGNGFFSTSFGALLLKRWTLWDVFFVPEVHYGFPRIFQTTGNSIIVQPGFGGSLGFGVGFSPGGGSFRLGVRLHPRLDQARFVPTMELDVREQGWVSNCDTGFDVAYMLGSHDTLSVFYTDQTLLGEARNTVLNRMAGVNYQHRWER